MSEPTSSESDPSGAASGVPSRRVFVALGSNVEPARYLPLAARRLADLFPGLAASRLYSTEAVGAPGAPPFYNAAVAFDTHLSLGELKHGVLRPLEADLGRRRGPDPNAPRTIDLDIVLCADGVVEDEQAGLRIPDPEILTRAHLALPLADLAPRATHPTDGRTLEEIAAAFQGCRGVEIVAPQGSWLPPAATAR